MNTRTSSIAIGICFLWLILPGLLRAADSDALELEVVPQTLEVGPCGQDSPLLVIVRNRTKSMVSDLQLSLLTDVPLEVEPKPDVKSAASQQQTSWQFRVKCTSEFPGSSLHVVLSGKLSADNRDAINQIVTKSIPVKLREPQTLESVAAIDIKSTLESLTDSDEGDIVVIVSNKTLRPITVSIAAKGPKFISLKPSTDEDEAKAKTKACAPPPQTEASITPPEKSIPPEKTVCALRTEPFTFIASANGRVRPGKQLLLFQVHMVTDRGSRDYLITREVSVGVIGQSEILKLLGVPSFFLLPGFLAASGFMLFWRWHVLRPSGSDTSPLDDKAFWLVAVTASLLISSLFLLWRRDVFSFYSLVDVMIIWWVSIGIGVGAYLGSRLWINRMAKQKRIKEEQFDQRTYPQPGDAPLAILCKMQAHNLTMDLDRVKLKGADSPAFVLLRNSDGSFYVCPEMVLTWDEAAPLS